VEALPDLLRRLSAADLELQKVTAEALEAMGPEAAAPLRERLPDLPPKAWRASVRALSRLLADEEARGWLADQAMHKLAEQEARSALPGAFRALGRSDLAELAEMHARDVSVTVQEGVWAVMERLADEPVIEAIRKTLASEDEETRSGGLEVLAEGVGERRLSQRLAAALQAEDEGWREWEPETAREAMAAAAESADDWWREMAAEWRRGEELGAMIEEQGLLGRLNKVVFLKKVPFFADLSLEELGLIAEAAVEKTFPDGEFLVRRGERHSAFYVVVEGNRELTSVSAAGWEGTLGVLGPGEVCGANSALDGSPSAVSAQAFFGEVRVLALERDEVTRLVRLYPEIGIGLLRASLARIRLLEEMMMRFDS
jgi:hypothetical protein